MNLNQAILMNDILDRTRNLIKYIEVSFEFNHDEKISSLDCLQSELQKLFEGDDDE